MSAMPSQDDFVPRALLGDFSADSVSAMPLPAMPERAAAFPASMPHSAQQLLFAEREAANPIEGFAKTALYEATAGMVGIQPETFENFLGLDEGDIQQFRHEYPKTAIAAALLGTAAPFAIPFAGQGALGLRAAAKMPAIRRLAAFAENAPGAGYLGGAAREIARFAPLETARLAGAGAASLLGEEGAFPETAKHVAFDLGAFGVFGAGAAVLAGKLGKEGAAIGPDLGRKTRLLEHFARHQDDELRTVSRLSFEASAQEQIQHWRTLMESPKWSLVEDSLKADVQAEVKHLSEFVLRGEAKRYNARGEVIKPIGEIADIGVQPETGKKASKFFNTQFNPGPAGGINTFRFVKNKKAGRTQELIDDFIDKGGLRGKEGHIQDPRGAIADGLEQARIFEQKLDEFAQRVDYADGTFWVSQEKDNGLYVVVQKLERDADEARYVLFKSDSPDLFAGNIPDFTRPVRENAMRLERSFKKIKAEHMTDSLVYMRELIETLDRGLDYSVIAPSKLGSMMMGLMQGKPGLWNELTQAGRGLAQKAKWFASPTITEFSQNPGAVTMMGIAQALFARHEARAAGRFFGRVLEDAERPTMGLLGRTFRTHKRQGGVEPLLDAVYDKGDQAIMEMHEVFVQGLAPDSARVGEFLPEVQALVKKLDEVDGLYVDELLPTLKFTSSQLEFNPLKHHYGISRTWRGSYRARVTDADGATVGIGSGYTEKQALEEAQAIIKEAGPESGLFVDSKGVFEAGKEADLELARQLNAKLEGAKVFRNAKLRLGARSPGRFKERTGVKGFANPLTRQEMKNTLLGNYIESDRIIAKELFRSEMKVRMDKLRSENPVLHDQLTNRLAQLEGQKKLTQLPILKEADALLEKVLGKEMATRLAQNANRFIFDWTLAFGDLGFVALNAMTPIMTAMPEVAFVLNTPLERLQRYYGTAFVIGKDQSIKAVSHLDPLRILRQSFKELAKPDEQLAKDLKWAFDFRVAEKPFVEQVSGQQAEELMSIMKSLSRTGERGSGGGFLKWIQAFSEYGVGRSEIFSRGHSFVMGRIVGRDFFGLEGAQLREFARSFTGRSMYGYAVADRARIIQGHFGTVGGLFKNWPMHYLANFMTYTGEAVRQANFAPLLWANAGTWAMGGAAALPAFGIADSMSKMFNDKGLMQNTYEMFGYADRGPLAERGIDSLFYGLPAFLGLSLQGRASVPGAEARLDSAASILRDVNTFTNIALMDRAMVLGDAIGSSIDKARATGQHPIDSSSVRDLWYRALAPRTLYRSLALSKDGGLRSLQTGNRLLSDISMPERVAYTVGFAPLDLQKFYDVSSELWRDQNKIRERIGTYGDILSEARQEGNHYLQMQILRDAMTEGLPLESVWKSADRRVYQDQTDLLERQFRTAQSRALQRSVGLR